MLANPSDRGKISAQLNGFLYFCCNNDFDVGESELDYS